MLQGFMQPCYEAWQNKGLVYSIDCLTVDEVGSLNPVKCPVGFEPKPSDSITKPYPLDYFLLDYLFNMGFFWQWLKLELDKIF